MCGDIFLIFNIVSSNLSSISFHLSCHLCVLSARSFSSFLQLLAVFMQMGARELLMHYMDLKQTNDVQLTFEALKVNSISSS